VVKGLITPTAENLQSIKFETASMGDVRGAYMFLVGKREGKRQIKRTRSRWDDNIKMNLSSIGRAWTGFVWLKKGTSGELLY
jgi:DNA-binding IclR family transcriptional regulator